jgi:hypothetical protein
MIAHVRRQTSRRSDAHRPELVAARELQLPQHRAHVGLDGLRADVELAGDLLVRVAPRDEPEHLALPRRELVELGIDRWWRAPGERVEHEAREPRREHRVALVHPSDRVGELRGRDRLRHVAAGAGTDHGDDVLGRVRDAEREEPHAWATLHHTRPAPVRKMHVEQHHIGLGLEHTRDRRFHGARVADQLEALAELRPHAAREQLVILDEEHADHVRDLGIRSRTSVPRPGELSTTATPPLRSIRPSIDPAIPRRSAGTDDRAKPTP